MAPDLFLRGFCLVLFFYQCIVRLFSPLIRVHINRRAQAGREDPVRLNERYGQASAPPFDRSPIWIHAASVGEAQSALQLINTIKAHRPDQPILMTTGTVTSAQVMAGRLPLRCIHQYAPIDHPVWVRRFLAYWQPVAAIRLESEIWPTTLMALSRSHIPTALLNATISEKSFRYWRIVPHIFRKVMRCFRFILAENTATIDRLHALGVPSTLMNNLKFVAAPLTVDEQARITLHHDIHNRPTLLFASTHKGEEIMAARIHCEFRAQNPDLLTFIVPRHPARRDDILNEIETVIPRSGIAVRSFEQQILPATQIYLADTMGELGLFYAICPFAVIGRSYSIDGGGGHNPIEAAQMGCYPLSGPMIQNLQSLYDTLALGDAVEICETPHDLKERISDLLTHPEMARARGARAQDYARSLQSRIVADLDRFVDNFLSMVPS